ncbi:MAG: hypothetical protein IT521_08135 [Burkholderiales bacterium]|nr:hypothetical protein [Burkholderiales bacterium]
MVQLRSWGGGVALPRHRSVDCTGRASSVEQGGSNDGGSRIIPCFAWRKWTMDAEQINVIDNTLADLARRTAELRRYL